MILYTGKEKLIVLDYTLHSAIPFNLRKENIHVLQIDLNKKFQSNKCDIFSLYPSLDSAKKVILPAVIDEKLIKNVDSKIMEEIAEITNDTAKKAAYLSKLEEETQNKSDDFKKSFITYLLNTDHLLKKERHCFRWHSYSNQTRSFQTAVLMLLKPIIPIVKNKKLLLNEETLTRHIPAITRKFTY